MDATWIQSLYITMYSFTVLLLSIAVILMATDRVHTEFEYLASRDPLTGALNRRALLDACRPPSPATGRRRVALLMVDLDHFKSINDRFGHLMGDAVLREAVGRMQRAIGDAGRAGALRRRGVRGAAARRGPGRGDEHRAAPEAGHRRALPADSPLAAVGAIAVSIGVAASEEGHRVDDVLAKADAALYRAKALGRGIA
jgi:GGDEF domain-containing protein